MVDLNQPTNQPTNQSGPGGNINEGVLPRASELKHHHQIHFNMIHIKKKIKETEENEINNIVH